MPEALPELGALAAAGFLLLIAAALWVLDRLLTNTLGHAPLIGSWVSNTLSGWINDARNAILRASSASWGAAKQLFRWMQAFLKNPLATTIYLAAQVWRAFSNLRNITLPALESRALVWASSLFSQAQAAVNSAEVRALVYASGLVSRAEATALGWVDTALAYSAGLFARAEADTLALVGRAEAGAANLITEASTELRAGIANAEALAAGEVSALQASVQSAVNQLASDLAGGLAGAEALASSQVQALQQGIITDLETTGDAAIRLAWPDAVPDLQALRDVLGADFPWLNDLLGLMAGAGTAGLLGALIRSMATSQAVTRLATDCIVPNCRNLSGLGSLLQDLEGLLAGDLLFGLLAAAVADPQAAARDIEAALYRPAADTVSLISQLLGA